MRYITVKCPKCREVLEIDTQSGVIVKHHPELKTKPGSDFLGERLQSLEKEKAHREALVAESREKEKRRQEKFGKIFDKVRKQAKEGPPKERPLREIDID